MVNPAAESLPKGSIASTEEALIHVLYVDDELDYQIRDGIEYARQRNNWTTECGVQRVAHGMAHRVDRLKAVGNGQVPQCASVAFRILTKGLL